MIERGESMQGLPEARTLGAQGWPAPGSRRDAIEGLLLDRRTEVQYQFIQFMSEHLSECSRAFDGDLQEVLILSIIAQAAVDGRRSKGFPKQVNASRIADVTGIPRQTVRRKLVKLGERGWIRQNPNATWEMAGAPDDGVSRERLGVLDGAGLKRLARLYVALEQVMKQDG